MYMGVSLLNLMCYQKGFDRSSKEKNKTDGPAGVQLKI